jgi:NADH-quinone oxidoreductase subunit M
MTVSVLIFLPVIAALAVLFIKNEAVKHAALFFAVVELAVAVYFLINFVPDASVQFAINVPWIFKLGIYFNAGIDGISMVMVLLTTLLVPLIILSTYQHNYKNASAFYALILFMQAGLMVVFTAWDGFLFYVGWEAALIPIYFICALWGGVNRIRVTLKFFIYTFAGSLFMLTGIIYLYLQTPANSYDLTQFYALHLDSVRQSWVFWAFFLAFAIKIPLFPFHTWQPDTYTEAPAAGSMLLAGIMLKMGLYGVIRWLIPNVPLALLQWQKVPLGYLNWQNLVMVLAVIGVVYGAIIAFTQKEGKRLVAYSSISHVGLIAAGIFTLGMQGLQGGIIQMLSHGINVVGMFFVWDIIARRMNTTEINQLGGIAKVAPKFATGFLIIVLGTVALPLTNGFIGEVLLLFSIYDYNFWFGAVAGLTIIFGAVYMLRMYKKVMQGETNALTATFTDVTGSEQIVLAIICVLIIFIGIYPQPILHLSQAAVDKLMMVVQSKIMPGAGQY